MEQIRLRQPKIEAAQSFIQNLGAFLTKLLNLIASNSLKIKKRLSLHRIVKTVSITGLKRKNFYSIPQKGKT